MEDMDLLFELAGLALVEVARAWCLGNRVATARVGRPSLCPSLVISKLYAIVFHSRLLAFAIYIKLYSLQFTHFSLPVLIT